MNEKFKSKIPYVGDSIFTIMTQLSLKNDALNMSQGFPDFNVDFKIIDLVEKFMRNGYNQYAPMQGVELLREKISVKTESLYKLKVDPYSEITITSGATEAIFCAISSVVNTGDEVIIFDPSYDCYSPIVEFNKGIPIHIPMEFPGYKINWNKVNDFLSPKTRMIIINSPHNPTGTIFSIEDIESLRTILLNRKIVLLSDEVYEHIVFDNLVHQSVLRHPDLFSKSFIISSFGKTYHTTGWKVGYCIAPKAFTNEFRKIHQFVTFSSNTPIQYAYAQILDDTSYYLYLSSFYEKKRNFFVDLLKKSRFNILECNGTYFQLLDYSNISELNDTDFSFKLVNIDKIACIPISVFHKNKKNDKVLRFCFAKKDNTLVDAAKILCKI